MRYAIAAILLALCPALPDLAGPRLPRPPGRLRATPSRKAMSAAADRASACSALPILIGVPALFLLGYADERGATPSSPTAPGSPKRPPTGPSPPGKPPSAPSSTSSASTIPGAAEPVDPQGLRHGPSLGRRPRHRDRPRRLASPPPGPPWSTAPPPTRSISTTISIPPRRTPPPSSPPPSSPWPSRRAPPAAPASTPTSPACRSSAASARA